MSKTFRPYEPSQSFLFPPSPLDPWLPPVSPAGAPQGPRRVVPDRDDAQPLEAVRGNRSGLRTTARPATLRAGDAARGTPVRGSPAAAPHLARRFPLPPRLQER